jgi:hypothetical protein
MLRPDISDCVENWTGASRKLKELTTNISQMQTRQGQVHEERMDKRNHAKCMCHIEGKSIPYNKQIIYTNKKLKKNYYMCDFKN